MNTTTISDVNDREIGVFIPVKYWEEIKKAIPSISQSIAEHSLTELVTSFSLFTLHELSQSILSGLKVYYGRSILLEEEQYPQNKDKIKHLEEQMAHVFALQRDSANFNSRQRMEEIITTYAPLLSSTV